MPTLVSHPDEVRVLSRRFGQGATNIDKYIELDVRNVLSYYSMLRTKPAGKYNVQICTNISCMLRGGYEILDHCKHKLGIGHKETTKDGVFSLEEVECIGACCWAPAIQINYDFHENLTPAKVDALFKLYRDGKGKDEK